MKKLPPKTPKPAKSSAPVVLDDPPASSNPGKAILQNIIRPFRGSGSKPAETLPPSLNTRGRRKVEVSIPLRNPSLVSSLQAAVVAPPAPSADRGSPLRRPPPLDTNIASFSPPSARRGPSSVASRLTPYDNFSAPSLPPNSPYSGGLAPSVSSLASVSSSSFTSITPSDPMYPLEVERLQLEFRRSQENLRLERQASLEQQELYRRAQVVHAETQRRPREEVAALRKQIEDGRQGGQSK